MSDDGLVVSFAWVWISILALMAALYVPLLILRCIEAWTGNRDWLGERLFGRKAP